MEAVLEQPRWGRERGRGQRGMRGYKGQGRSSEKVWVASCFGGGFVSVRSEELARFHSVELDFVWAAPGPLLGNI